MLSFLSKYKYILIAILALSLLSFVYFEGKSAGKDSGYLSGHREAEDKYKTQLEQTQQERDIIKTQYEKFVADSNKRVSQLEQESIRLSNDKKAWMKKYNSLLSSQTMSKENASKPAWTKETVKLINNIL